MLLDLVQLRLRQHPTIPHYHYSSQAELLPHLVHLVRDRCGISGIARIALYCYRSRSRQCFDEILESSPSLRIVPRMASTCPCGSVRSVRKRSFGETSGSSRRSRRRVSILCLGQSERLASVRLRLFLPSRHPSRSRMAGGESRLGTISIYMGAIIHTDTFISSTLFIFS